MAWDYRWALFPTVETFFPGSSIHTALCLLLPWDPLSSTMGDRVYSYFKAGLNISLFSVLRHIPKCPALVRGDCGGGLNNKDKLLFQRNLKLHHLIQRSQSNKNVYLTQTCIVMPVGTNNAVYTYKMDGTVLEASELVEGFGLLVNNCLTMSCQCNNSKREIMFCGF